MTHLNKATSSLVKNIEVDSSEISSIFTFEIDEITINIKTHQIYYNICDGYFIYLTNNAVYVNKEFFKDYDEYISTIKKSFQLVNLENLTITVKNIEFVKVFINKFGSFCVYYSSCISLYFGSYNSETYIKYEEFLKFKKKIEDLNFFLVYDFKNNRVVGIKKINNLLNDNKEEIKLKAQKEILEINDSNVPRNSVLTLKVGLKKYYFKMSTNEFSITLQNHPDCCGELIQYNHNFSTFFETEFLKNIDYFKNILHYVYKTQRRSVLATVRNSQVNILKEIGFVEIGSFKNIKTTNNLNHLFLDINNI